MTNEIVSFNNAVQTLYRMSGTTGVRVYVRPLGKAYDQDYYIMADNCDKSEKELKSEGFYLLAAGQPDQFFVAIQQIIARDLLKIK